MNPIDPASPELPSPLSPREPAAPKMNRASWTRHVQDCSGSGLSLETYCQQHNLKVERLKFWQDKLTREQRHANTTAAFVAVSVSNGNGLTPYTSTPFRARGRSSCY